MTAPRTRLSRRISSIAESATLKVDAKAKALKAQGRQVVSFAAGEPDFATPSYIVDAAMAAATDPAHHKYSPTAGLMPLRQAIAEKILRDSGIAISPDQVVVTNGGKQAIYQALAAIIDPGDEVLLPAPYWTTYPEAITLAGGVAVEVFAGVDQNYRVTVDQLEASRSAETKAVIFVSPSNPTGSVYSASETRAIGEWALRHDIWVISDEIYQNLTYDGVRALSILDVVPALSDQCILVNGVAKTYAMTGWRVGWLIGPEDVVRAVTNLQSNLTSHVSNISQMAATAALNGPAETIDRMRSAFDRRRRLIVEGLNGIDGIICPTPEGAFYVYADVAGLFGRSFGGVTPRSSLELADLILEKADVAVVPGEAFGRSGYLRFSYALADESIVEGLRRLRLLLA